jgi:hypothetical protein
MSQIYHSNSELNSDKNIFIFKNYQKKTIFNKIVCFGYSHSLKDLN